MIVIATAKTTTASESARRGRSAAIPSRRRGDASEAAWAPPARRRAINSAETRNVAASTAKNVLKGRNVSNAAASAQPPIASACASRSTTAGMVAP